MYRTSVRTLAAVRPSYGSMCQQTFRCQRTIARTRVVRAAVHSGIQDPGQGAYTNARRGRRIQNHRDQRVRALALRTSTNPTTAHETVAQGTWALASAWGATYVGVGALRRVPAHRDHADVGTAQLGHVVGNGRWVLGRVRPQRRIKARCRGQTDRRSEASSEEPRRLKKS